MSHQLFIDPVKGISKDLSVIIKSKVSSNQAKKRLKKSVILVTKEGGKVNKTKNSRVGIVNRNARKDNPSSKIMAETIHNLGGILPPPTHSVAHSPARIPSPHQTSQLGLHDNSHGHNRQQVSSPGGVETQGYSLVQIGQYQWSGDQKNMQMNYGPTHENQQQQQ